MSYKYYVTHYGLTRGILIVELPEPIIGELYVHRGVFLVPKKTVFTDEVAAQAEVDRLRRCEIEKMKKRITKLESYWPKTTAWH